MSREIEGDTRPVKATQIKVGNHVVYEGDVYRVLSTEKSKAGKHGHAKVRMAVENIISGSKKSLVMPGDDKMMQPIIDKRIAQVLAIHHDSLQLMDMESYATYETAIPNYEEIGGKLASGDEVTVWEFLGTRIIREKRAKSE